MDALSHLIATRPVVFVHMISALGALVLGAIVLARRKGTGSHRAIGWAWSVLMFGAAVSSAFIQDRFMPNLAGFTPIHLFTLFVGVQLPRAVLAARRGQIERHRQTMRGIYIGGCIVAGLFALLPQRFLGQQLWAAVGSLLA